MRGRNGGGFDRPRPFSIIAILAVAVLTKCRGSTVVFFFHLTYSRWTSSLPSCLWSQRIFPSLPGSRLTIFYRDASSALLQLVNQWWNFIQVLKSAVALVLCIGAGGSGQLAHDEWGGSSSLFRKAFSAPRKWCGIAAAGPVAARSRV